MLRCLGCLLIMSVWLSRAQAAAPLPEDPALDKPVTAAVEGPAAKVLEALSQASGLKLSIDELVGGWSSVVCVRDMPLRRVLGALVEPGDVSLTKEGDGAYRIAGPAEAPPLVPERKLVEALLGSCPSDVRPPMGIGPPKHEERFARPPMEQVYLALRKAQIEAIEEGEEIAFARLPSQAQRLLRDYFRDRARRSLWSVLNPFWMVPVERLALQVAGGFGNLTWVLRVRKPPKPQPEGAPAPADPPPPEGDWEPGDLWIPYQPLRAAAVYDPERPPFNRAVLDLAREAGINVIVKGMGVSSPGPQRGETTEAKLASLLNEWMREHYAWQLQDGVYGLRYVGPASSPDESDRPARARRNLEHFLPAYRPFLALDGMQRFHATRLPWLRLWQSLTHEQRTPGPPIYVAQLSREQQELLYRGLQSNMVQGFVSAVRNGPQQRLEQLRVFMNFEATDAREHGEPLGCLRVLGLRDASEDLVGATNGQLRNQPPILRLLPWTDPVMRKSVYEKPN